MSNTLQVDENSSTTAPQAGSDVVAMIKRLQEQMTFLERKIDTLIKASQERSFKGRDDRSFRGRDDRPFKGRDERRFGGNQFQKQRKPFGNFNRHGKRKQGFNSGQSQGGFNPARRFDRPWEGKNKKFKGRKKKKHFSHAESH
jgi:hypothetical protein